jgi:hypothetical protein
MAAALLAAGAIDEVKDCCHCVPVETKNASQDRLHSILTRGMKISNNLHKRGQSPNGGKERCDGY